MGVPTLKAVEVQGLDREGEDAFLRLSAGLPVVAQKLAAVAKAAGELGEDLVVVPAVSVSSVPGPALEAVVADLALLEKVLGPAEATRAKKLRALMIGLGGHEKAAAKKDDGGAPTTGGDVSTADLATNGGALVPAQGNPKKKPKKLEESHPAEQPGVLPQYREVNLGTEVALTLRDGTNKGSGTSLGLALASSSGPPPAETPDPKKKPNGKHLFPADVGTPAVEAGGSTPGDSGGGGMVGTGVSMRAQPTEKAGPDDQPRDEQGRWTTGGAEVGSDEKIVGAHMRRGYMEGLRQIREQRLTPEQAREALGHMRANAATPHDTKEDRDHQRGAMQAIREWARRSFARKSAEWGDEDKLAVLELEKRVRAEMPQIPVDKVQEFVTFLRARGVAVEPGNVGVSALRASQDDLNKSKVERIKAKGLAELLKGPPLLLANEYDVLDGHHRAAAIKELDPEAKVPCLVIQCGIDAAIAHAHEFPHAEVRGINDGVIKVRVVVKRAKKGDLDDSGEDEERTVFGIVLEPETVDSQGDIYSEDEVRQTAWRFAERYQHFGLMHRQIVPGIVLLETYLAPVDFEIVDRNGQAQKIKKGTWLLRVRVTDDSIWEAVKDGRLDGFSIGGSAVRQPLKGGKKTAA
jgi:hypothetical protein